MARLDELDVNLERGSNSSIIRRFSSITNEKRVLKEKNQLVKTHRQTVGNKIMGWRRNAIAPKAPASPSASPSPINVPPAVLANAVSLISAAGAMEVIRNDKLIMEMLSNHSLKEAREKHNLELLDV